MSVVETSVVEISVVEMSVVEMSVVEMSVVEMSVVEMPFSEFFCYACHFDFFAPIMILIEEKKFSKTNKKLRCDIILPIYQLLFLLN